MENSKYSNGTLHDFDSTSNGNGSGATSPNPVACTSSTLRSDLTVQAIAAENAMNNDDDEGDDEYCIYTYKGDRGRGAADLPSSFFKFEQGDSLSSIEDNCSSSSTLPLNLRLGYNGIDAFGTSSTATTHHHTLNGSVVTVSGSRVNGAGRPQSDLFSPDMDFLEMDFDPGGVGDDEDEFPVGDNQNVGETDDDDMMRKLLNQFKTDITPFSSGPSGSGPPSNENHPAGRSIQEVDVTDSPMNENYSTSIYSQPTSSNSVGTTSNKRVLISNTEMEMDIALEITQCTPSVANTSYPARIPAVTAGPSSPQPHCSKDFITHFQQCPPLLNPQLYLTQESSNRQFMMRLVKSNTLPEIRTSRINDAANGAGNAEVVGENNPPRITRNSCLSSSAPVIKNEPCYRAVINTSFKSCSTEDDSIELEVGSIMICSVEEAYQKTLKQIGTSACGATAVCNVLKVLGYDYLDPSYINSCVKTRLRDNSAEIPEYLFSRTVAGATHKDLINGITIASNGLVTGRFFQPKPGIETRNFSKWLLHWICKGAVPVVTRNMQIQTECSDHPIPDAWHHQMIFGISPDGIFMTNPIECKSPTLVIPQITSPSVILIRRSDVIDRKTPTTDLRKLTRHFDPQWNELNVLGQVANILLEEIPVFSSTSIAKRVRTSHIEIPAAYKGGITLFMPTNSPFYSLLMEAPEL